MCRFHLFAYASICGMLLWFKRNCFVISHYCCCLVWLIVIFGLQVAYLCQGECTHIYVHAHDMCVRMQRAHDMCVQCRACVQSELFPLFAMLPHQAVRVRLVCSGARALGGGIALQGCLRYSGCPFFSGGAPVFVLVMCFISVLFKTCCIAQIVVNVFLFLRTKN